jgi:hypothetical protein
MRILTVVFVAAVLSTAPLSFSQSGNTTAGLAGIGAGAALGASSGTGSTTSSGAGGAPVEVQIMSFYGLDKIAADVAKVATRVCTQGTDCPILLEDPVSANQLALYHSVYGYVQKLSLLHEDLQKSLPITVVALPQPMSAVAGQKDARQIQLKNLSAGLLVIKAQDVEVKGEFANVFSLKFDPQECTIQQQGSTCNLTVTFSPPANADAMTFSATLEISYVGPGSNIERITFPVSGTASKAPQSQSDLSQNVPTVSLSPDQTNDISKNQEIDLNNLTPDQISTLEKKLHLMEKSTHAIHQTTPKKGDETNTILQSTVPGLPNLGTSPPSAPSTPSAPTPPATPYNLQWTNGLSTDAGSLKAGMGYSSSSTSATTQSFEVLVENELTKQLGYKILPYTSTSALNLKDASQDMSYQFSQMLAMDNDITTWTNECGKNPSSAPTPTSSTVTYSACNDTNVVADLPVAAQLFTAYSTLLTMPSDGNGNPVIVDVLRGRALSQLAGRSIPSLQLAVLGASGSTKTNSYFGVSLFYQFAPSYNAGVIASFELRDGSDHLVDAGVRNVLYGYKKWNPGHMSDQDHRSVDTHIDGCGFCSSKP